MSLDHGKVGDGKSLFGIQYFASTMANPSNPNIDNPAIPNRVWKISATSPGRSLIPPETSSWHARIKFCMALRSIQSRQSSIDSEDNTHHE